MQVTYVKLDYAKVAKEAHLALRRLIEWFCSKEDIVAGFGEMEGEGQKYKDDPMLMRQVMGQIIPAIVANDPRKFYEFFDDFNIRISISEHPDSTDENPSFTYHNSVKKESKVANTRHEAEQNAFYDAFKLLNSKILSDATANQVRLPEQNQADEEEQQSGGN